MHTQNQESFLRLRQIIGDPKANPPIKPRIPVSRSTWIVGVRKGLYPKPHKLSARTVAWKESDIQALVLKMSKAACGE